MFLWFLATSVVTIHLVFRDPRFDYRWLMVGALLPLPMVWALHSVTFSVALLALVMVATIGRRPLRRALLGLPLGTLLHLVFTGAWSRSDVFWWPFFGFGLDDVTHPVIARGWWNVPLELIGLVGVMWIWRRIDWRTGHLTVASYPA